MSEIEKTAERASELVGILSGAAASLGHARACREMSATLVAERPEDPDLHDMVEHWKEVEQLAATEVDVTTGALADCFAELARTLA
jgi:hypothetical protein